MSSQMKKVFIQACSLKFLRTKTLHTIESQKDPTNTDWNTWKEKFCNATVFGREAGVKISLSGNDTKFKQLKPGPPESCRNFSQIIHNFSVTVPPVTKFPYVGKLRARKMRLTTSRLSSTHQIRADNLYA